MSNNKDNTQYRGFCGDNRFANGTFRNHTRSNAELSMESMVRLKMLADMMDIKDSKTDSLKNLMVRMLMINSDMIDPTFQMMMTQMLLGGSDSSSRNIMAQTQLIQQLTGEVDQVIIFKLMNDGKDYDYDMLITLVSLLHYSVEEIHCIINNAQKLSKDQLSAMDVTIMECTTDWSRLQIDTLMLSKLIRDKKFDPRSIIHDIVSFKSGHIDLSTLIGLWLPLESFKFVDKSASVKTQKVSYVDHMAVLRDGLDDVHHHSIKKLAHLVFKAKDQNKDRDNELFILKNNVLGSISKKFKKYLSNTTGQLVLRNLLNNVGDNITTTALMALHEKAVSLDFVHSLFEEKDGVYRVSTAVETLESDFKDSDFSKDFIASLEQYDSVLNTLNKAVKTIETNRENEEKEKQQEKLHQQRLEEERVKSLNAEIIDAAIKNLKESGVYEQIIEKVKKDLISATKS